MHVAIIMDGNGRWAQRRGLPRSAGHKAGARMVRRIVEAAARGSIDVLTLYAFSSDNWSRPTQEIATLMRLFKRYLVSETARCLENNVRLSVIGRRDRLSADLVRTIENTERLTAAGSGLELRLAIDYSARASIVRAIAGPQPGDARNPVESFEVRLAEAMHAQSTAPVDLLIRTGGEHRLSDFLLWECAYAELVFVEHAWPDFDEATFDAALREYACRERRFGGLPSAEPAPRRPAAHRDRRGDGQARQGRPAVAAAGDGGRTCTGSRCHSRSEMRRRYALLINPFYPKDPHASFGKHVLTPTLALTSFAGGDARRTGRSRYWDENLLQGPPPRRAVPAGRRHHGPSDLRRAAPTSWPRWYRRAGREGRSSAACTCCPAPRRRAPHADALAVGEGVQLWPQILRDVEARHACSRVYRGRLSHGPTATIPPPRRDLLPRGSFLTTTSLIATRGCHNRCGFCYLATDGLHMPYQMRDAGAGRRRSSRPTTSPTPCSSTTTSARGPTTCARSAARCGRWRRSGARR